MTTSESPYKRLRLLSGVKQKDLAQQAQVSVTALVNIEAGLYEVVPVRANAALAKACAHAGLNPKQILLSEYGHTGLNTAMDGWKVRHRRELDLSALPEMGLEQLIAQFDKPDRFCKALCIPTAALHNYRSGKLRVLPTVIREALADAGYQHVDRLEELSG